jgi:hypothetical protein
MPTLSIRSNQRDFLDHLKVELQKIAQPAELSIEQLQVETDFGLGETWFTLNTLLAFGAGVSANVIANHISNAIERVVVAYTRKKPKLPNLEAYIEDRLVDPLVRQQFVEAIASIIASNVGKVDTIAPAKSNKESQ